MEKSLAHGPGCKGAYWSPEDFIYWSRNDVIGITVRSPDDRFGKTLSGYAFYEKTHNQSCHIFKLAAKNHDPHAIQELLQAVSESAAREGSPLSLIIPADDKPMLDALTAGCTDIVEAKGSLADYFGEEQDGIIFASKGADLPTGFEQNVLKFQRPHYSHANFSSAESLDNNLEMARENQEWKAKLVEKTQVEWDFVYPNARGQLVAVADDELYQLPNMHTYLWLKTHKPLQNVGNAYQILGECGLNRCRAVHGSDHVLIPAGSLPYLTWDKLTPEAFLGRAPIAPSSLWTEHSRPGREDDEPPGFFSRA